MERLEAFEDAGVDYIVKDPEKYRNKKVVIAGGGDSALDWAIYLAEITDEISLVHRRKGFRGAPDSVEKVNALAKKGKLRLFTEAQVKELKGNDQLTGLSVEHDTDGIIHIDTDYFIPLFGLTTKLGPIANWGLAVDSNAIEVNPLDYSTGTEGIYAIGDINTYPGKLKLILCGFHEATLMVHSAFKFIYP